MNLSRLSVRVCLDYIILILGLPESAFSAMLILCLMTLHYFYFRVRTVLQCVLLVYMAQAACPPAPAIITHPALQSTAPVSAGKVQYNLLIVKVQNLLSFIRYASLAVLYILNRWTTRTHIYWIYLNPPAFCAWECKPKKKRNRLFLCT